MASGENRAAEAAQVGDLVSAAREHQSSGATGVLMNITGGPDMGLFEVNEAATIIRPGGAQRLQRDLRGGHRRVGGRPPAGHGHRHRLRRARRRPGRGRSRRGARPCPRRPTAPAPRGPRWPGRTARVRDRDDVLDVPYFLSATADGGRTARRRPPDPAPRGTHRGGVVPSRRCRPRSAPRSTTVMRRPARSSARSPGGTCRSTTPRCATSTARSASARACSTSRTWGSSRCRAPARVSTCSPR